MTHAGPDCAFYPEQSEANPNTIRVFEDAWTRFVPFVAFPPMLRRMIYTTNAIESLNYQLHKVTKNRGHFPSDEALEVASVSECASTMHSVVNRVARSQSVVVRRDAEHAKTGPGALTRPPVRYGLRQWPAAAMRASSGQYVCSGRSCAALPFLWGRSLSQSHEQAERNPRAPITTNY